eukprot:1530249-Rhodomonas_salina.1
MQNKHGNRRHTKEWGTWSISSRVKSGLKMTSSSRTKARACPCTRHQHPAITVVNDAHIQQQNSVVPVERVGRENKYC